MANQRPTPKVAGLVAASFTVLLVGCSGTTYGTGVTQEQQLLDDVTSLATLGTGNKRKKINYDSRPKLVKVTDTSTLPSPAETVDSESAYFPENPEEKRAKLRAIAANEDPNEISPEVAALREESRLRQKVVPNKPHEDRSGGSIADIRAEQERVNQVIAQKAQNRRVNGAQQRRYLTEPPNEYRQPAETAPVGVTGENEKPPGAKTAKDKNFLDGIFGG